MIIGDNNNFFLGFSGFFSIWAIFILIVTVFIGLFKNEKYKLEDGHKKIGVFQNYKLLWDILKIPRVRVLAVALLTIKVNNNNKAYIILINKYYIDNRQIFI